MMDKSHDKISVYTSLDLEVRLTKSKKDGEVIHSTCRQNHAS